MSKPDGSEYQLRVLEAVLFASARPLSESELKARLPGVLDVSGLLAVLQKSYAGRGVALKKVAGGWAFRTAEDLSFLLQEERKQEKRLSRAALETLAIVAYHQPVTRAEIEYIRGVSTARGTLDVLLETGWVCMKGRRRSPGRPVTYGTTSGFLDHFNLESVKDLPGLAELKATGILGKALPSGASGREGGKNGQLSYAGEFFTPDGTLEETDN